MSWSGWLLHRHIYVKIIQITLCCILLYVIYTSKNKFKKFHKVNSPSLFSLKFSWLLLLLYFAIVKNLESLWWLWRCTAQISFQENLWWKGKWLLLSFCPWPLLAFDGNTVEILSQAIMAHYGWFSSIGHFCFGDPYQPAGDFLRAALQSQALPTQFFPFPSSVTGSVLHGGPPTPVFSPLHYSQAFPQYISCTSNSVLTSTRLEA